MFIEVRWVDEGGGTFGALVWLFSRMGTHMHDQVVLVLRLVWAQVTEEMERVCVNAP